MANLRVFAEWIVNRHAQLEAVTEIRVLRRTQKGERSAWVGYFGPGEVDALVSQLRPNGAKPRRRIPGSDHARNGEANFYFTLNGVLLELAERAGRGRLTRARETARDMDIAVTTLFPIDIDPVRPSNTSATDGEKRQALDVVEKVREWQKDRGVSTIFADSGNGYHLLVPLEPIRGEGIPKAAREGQVLLKLLHSLFSTEGAKVDTAVFNPARIFKLYGTLAVKGASSKERPHRVASVDLSNVPPDVALFEVLRGEIDAFREQAGGKRKATIPAQKGKTRPSGAHRKGPSTVSSTVWQQWRQDALAALPLDAIYGHLLTGVVCRAGWLECRDPASPSGDRNPSAGVADGSGSAERGTFHSFRSGDSFSAFDRAAFRFLVQQGLATDFRTACAWVADTSGVPLPGRLEALPGRLEALPGRLEALPESLQKDSGHDCLDLAEVDAFVLELRAERSPRIRVDRIRAVLSRLVSCPALEQNAALELLAHGSFFTLPVLKRTLSELRHEARAQPPRPLADDLPVLDIVKGEEAISTIFNRLVDALEPFQNFFNRQDGLVFVHTSAPPIPVHERNLPGLLSSLLEIRLFQRCDGKAQFVGYEPLPTQLAKAFVNSPRVRRRLPTLVSCGYAPFFASDLAFINRPGYHPVDGGVFYDGPVVAPKPGSTTALDTLLRGTPWKSPVDRVNCLGAMLTALTISRWTSGHPVIVINSNREGTGKSTLAQAMALIMDGRKPTSITLEVDQAEFEKQLATQVEMGSRLIIIDNVKLRRPIQSAVLERTVTDWRPHFKDKWGGLRSEHAQTVIVGKLFHAYRGWDFKVGEAVWRLARQEPRGRTHSPLYHFEKVVMAGETGSREDTE